MKLLLLTDRRSRFAELRRAAFECSHDAEVSCTPFLRSAVPYLLQEPGISWVLLDLELCGWGELSNWTEALKPALIGRKLGLLVHEPSEMWRLDAQCIPIDTCFDASTGLDWVAEQLIGLSEAGSSAMPLAETLPASLYQPNEPESRSTWEHRWGTPVRLCA